MQRPISAHLPHLPSAAAPAGKRRAPRVQAPELGQSGRAAGLLARLEQWPRLGCPPTDPGSPNQWPANHVTSIPNSSRSWRSAKKVKTQKTVQLGEIVQVIGADTLPIKALAGALLAARRTIQEDSRKPSRGGPNAEQAFFQQGGKKGKKPTAGDTASGTSGNGGTAPPSDRAA